MKMISLALLIATPTLAQGTTYRQRVEQAQMAQLAAQAAALAAACQAAKDAGTALPAGCPQ